MLPNLKYEKKYWSEGFENVCGIDEVGRGCLAGPLYVGAVAFHKNSNRIKGVNDSKKLTARQRERLYEEIVKKAKAWGIGSVDSEEIDQYGLTVATKTAIQRAVGNLTVAADILLIDAFSYEKIKSVGITKGDEKCYSIAAASIVAKVERDRYISSHPEAEKYGLDKNKGYGTREHYEMLEKHGPSSIHRKSFRLTREVTTG